MAEQTQPGTAAPNSNSLDDMIAESDTGGRKPGGIPARVLWFVPLAWSLFQLWYASPLPFVFGVFVLNDTEARAVHLAFALFLTYLAYPASAKSPRDRIPLGDWALAFIGAATALYIYIAYRELADRPGLPTWYDLAVAIAGIAILLEATRRALGPPLMVVAIVFILYTFGGPYFPDVIAHKGASLGKGMSHYWLSTEGVFGVALGVSTSMVFLFVLFGSLLEKAGAGNYFIRVAFALLGHMRGGPAKAAVVSSAMTGLVSGSSIANVVTTGTFTIPLMRKVGFSAEKAGAVEVASSTNGQLMPPVMGAAAFLMVEYVGISYVDVIRHAFLPAVISYIALVYIVHLEALKSNMKGLPRRTQTPLIRSLITFVATILGLIVISGVVYYGIGWIKDAAGAAAVWIVTGLLVVAYVALVRYASAFPELEQTDRIDELPEPGPTVKAGLYFLLPVVVLVWCLTVERLSPGLSAFWATVFMMVVVVTHRRLKAIFRRIDVDADHSLMRGLDDLLQGLVGGGRNMIAIGVATAAAGIVVGTVTLTGIGLVMTEFVEFISGGNLMLMLLFTAGISLLLGMGLPTTANYIVVSTLMAPVIVSLGAQQGLIVPLIAVHMFVFYFGILADDTPPVGLAAFAAAAISGGDPIKTGLQGFAYDIRTAILPFMFIFNTQLLMIDIDGPFHLGLTIATAILAMITFAAATQGYFLVKSRIWETAALLLVAFTLFRPGFWMDMIYPPLRLEPPSKLEAIVEAAEANDGLRLEVKGETVEGKKIEKVVFLPLGPKGPAAKRLAFAGIDVAKDGDKLIVDNVRFGSPAKKQKLDLDFEIVGIHVDSGAPDKEWMFIPAIGLLALIYALQRRRRRDEEAAETVSAAA